MRFILVSFLFLTVSKSYATDFYFRCESMDQKIELDFNLTRGSWVSIKGLSPYWTHLMLMEVKRDTHVFEVHEAGAGEADFLRLEVPANFMKGSLKGRVQLSAIDGSTSADFYCARDVTQED